MAPGVFRDSRNFSDSVKAYTFLLFSLHTSHFLYSLLESQSWGLNLFFLPFLRLCSGLPPINILTFKVVGALGYLLVMSY